jgi:phosphoribosylaminoimidazole-succinocarboxamide synthase
MSAMKKLNMLYEGKAKKVYQTENEDLYIVDYKDDATAFNGLKKGSIAGKGVINNKMTNIIFQYLAQNGIENHFVKELSDRETLVKKVEIVPLEVIVRNIAAGSFSQKYGVEEGTQLNNAILEFSYKNDALGDPMINDMQITAIGIATIQELKTITESALKINELMKKFFIERDIILVDFKIEFGKYQNKIILADEVSPDTCRLWDANTKQKLDKDRFRRDLGGVEEAYEEVWKRIISK